MSIDNKQLAERVEQLEAQVLQLKAVLDEIIASNLPINSLLYFDDDKNEATRPFTLRFDDKLDIPNVHPAESWGGKSFRWLGPNPVTTLSIPRERSVGYDIAISIAHFTGGPNTLAGTTIRVDGEILASRLEDVGGEKVITAILPPLPSAVHFPAFLLTIEYPKVQQLREPEARVVTLAVSQISIMPRR